MDFIGLKQDYFRVTKNDNGLSKWIWKKQKKKNWNFGFQ